MKPAHATAPSLTHPGHESSDIDARAIRRGIIAIALGLVVVTIAAGLLTRIAAPAHRGPISTRTPPAIQLQSDPRSALAAYETQKHAELTQYAWVDRDLGIVRVPIERAMTLLVERNADAAPASDDGRAP